MRNSIITTALATLAMAATATPAAAETVSVEVDYADLDITTNGGMNALEERIEGAVRTICGSQPARRAYPNRPLATCMRYVGERVEPQLEALRHGPVGTVYIVSITFDEPTDG